MEYVLRNYLECNEKVIVKHTFVEIVTAGCELPIGSVRRSCSDPALYNHSAEEEREIARKQRQDEIDEFEIDGLSDLDSESDTTLPLSTGTKGGVARFGSSPPTTPHSEGSLAGVSFDDADVITEPALGKVSGFGRQGFPSMTHIIQHQVTPAQVPSEDAKLRKTKQARRLPTTSANYLNKDEPQEKNAIPANSSARVPATNRGIPRGFTPLDGNDNATTVILRNVPNNYNRTMLLAMLDQAGFAGKYDFLYLPVDFNSRASLGYAFVNLVDAETVPKFWKHFDGFSRWSLPSKKVCCVGWAGPHQGLAAHVNRYKNSPVMHESVPDEFKPVLFKDGVRVPFPSATKLRGAPQVRQREVPRQRSGRGNHQR